MKKIQLALLTVVLFGTAAHADTLFNDYGPGDTYDTNQQHNWAVDNSQWVAVPFTISDTYQLDTIEFSLVFSLPFGQLSVSLDEDSGSGTPGTALTTWDLTPTDGTTTLSGHDIWLSPGTYYVALTTPNASTAWSWNSIGDTQTVFFDEQQTGWLPYSELLPALKVTGNPQTSSAPGPMAILPFGLGLARCVRRRR